MGDSLTNGSDTDADAEANNRWPGLLLSHLKASSDPSL